MRQMTLRGRLGPNDSQSPQRVIDAVHGGAQARNEGWERLGSTAAPSPQWSCIGRRKVGHQTWMPVGSVAGAYDGAAGGRAFRAGGLQQREVVVRRHRSVSGPAGVTDQ